MVKLVTYKTINKPKLFIVIVVTNFGPFTDSDSLNGDPVYNKGS